MLNKLAKDDTKWREIAYKLCRDRMLADDLVQDMYIKLAESTKQINEFYVIAVMRNLFFDYLKAEKKKIPLHLLYSLEAEQNNFELDDNEKEIIDNLYWVARDYFIMNYDMSLRKMAKELNTNYAFIYRTMKKEKEKWVK